LWLALRSPRSSSPRDQRGVRLAYSAALGLFLVVR